MFAFARKNCGICIAHYCYFVWSVTFIVFTLWIICSIIKFNNKIVMKYAVFFSIISYQYQFDYVGMYDVYINILTCEFLVLGILQVNIGYISLYWIDFSTSSLRMNFISIVHRVFLNLCCSSVMYILVSTVSTL